MIVPMRLGLSRRKGGDPDRGSRLAAREWLLVIGALLFAPLFFFKYLLGGDVLKAVAAMGLFIAACLVLGWARE